MSENSSFQNEGKFPRDHKEVVELLKRMQCQMDSIEEKLDALIRDSKAKSFSGKPFSKPFRSHDKSKPSRERKFEGKKEEVSSEGKFYHGSPFGKKKDHGKTGMRHGKKSYKK